MAPSKTKTVKNKYAAGKRSDSDGVAKKKPAAGGKAPSKEVTQSSLKPQMDKKKKKKTYTEAELGIPELNGIRPAGVVKPKGQKKGKVFVDDPESMRTILAIVQAEKEGQIESKMIKARQMEEIREARRAEAEKREQEKKDKLEGVKDSMRKKRKKNVKGAAADDGVNEKEMATTGSKASKPKKKKSVAFAA